MKSLIPNTKVKNDVFYTPEPYCSLIVNHFKPKGKVLEPCCGSGNFLKYLPANTDWCEITKGRDFFDYNKKVDWIITNPPFSLFRKFLQHSMELSTSIVFFAVLNHFWLKARLRDITENGFGIKDIMLTDTPFTFPQSGFQVGCVKLEKGYKDKIEFLDFRNMVKEEK
jgi:hypothetical protein